MNMPTFRQTKSIPETVKKKREKKKQNNNNKNSGVQAKSLTLKKESKK